MPIINGEGNKTKRHHEGNGAKTKSVKDKGIPAAASSINPKEPKYSFEDIILQDDARTQLMDALSFFQHQDKIFKNWGLEKTHKFQKKVAINLFGPPGTGKTMSAHAAASFLEKKIIEVSYSEIESKYVGETTKNLVSVFREAESTDSVLFFDEADAILSRRVENMSSSTDVSVNQTRSVLLMLLNNFVGTVIFATNFISNYDPAFMRRMLANIELRLPDENGRSMLWNKLLPSQLPTDLSIPSISRSIDEISGSDISNAVLSASLRAAREEKSHVPGEYFFDAIERIKEAKSKNEKKNHKIKFSQKEVSEEYVKENLKGDIK